MTTPLSPAHDNLCEVEAMPALLFVISGPGASKRQIVSHVLVYFGAKGIWDFENAQEG